MTLSSSLSSSYPIFSYWSLSCNLYIKTNSHGNFLTRQESWGMLSQFLVLPNTTSLTLHHSNFFNHIHSIVIQLNSYKVKDEKNLRLICVLKELTTSYTALPRLVVLLLVMEENNRPIISPRSLSLRTHR